MIPWWSWHLLPWRRPLPPRKNQVSETGRHTFIVLYCFRCVHEFFLCRRLFFTIFLMSNIVATCALNAWLDHVFWCRYHLVSTKKKCTIIPHDIGWFCRNYADNNQLVIHESVNDVVVVIVLWSWHDNYLLGAQYCPPSYPLTVSTG